MKVTDCAVSIGDGVVTVKRRGTRKLILAKILGTVVVDGLEVICLDRLVHERIESEMGGWHVSGAISTLLTRPIGPLPAQA
ncbi:MAG TPA: hypothetical protein VM659_13765 [Dongiaceae bacterium]|nr:hypothetical protein [Dongiaceae bacterium]